MFGPAASEIAAKQSPSFVKLILAGEGNDVSISYVEILKESFECIPSAAEELNEARHLPSADISRLIASH
jgi:hypothetical protein